MNYYNEYDPHAAAWLQELIDAGELPPGFVDTRSIEDVTPAELTGYTQCHFFAGIGGWPLALRLAGWPDDRPVWTGSCPCQPFSAAGTQGGTDDERHLWPAFRWLIQQCCPAVVFGEQVASKAGRSWLAGVQTDLQAMGYATAGADICAAGVGAPHIRQRVWWVGHAERERLEIRKHLAGVSPGEVGAQARQVSVSPGGDSGMANPDQQPRQQNARSPFADEATHGGEGRHRKQSYGHNGSAGYGEDASRLEHTLGLGRNTRGPEPSGWGAASGCSESGEVANAGVSTQQPGEPRPGQRRVPGRSEQNPWQNAIWIPCADGKARRIEPGTQPLVDGIPRGVVPGSDPGAPRYAQNTGEARKMRLSGYGNAIVPQVAAEFIMATVEAAQ